MHALSSVGVAEIPDLNEYSDIALSAAELISSEIYSDSYSPQEVLSRMNEMHTLVAVDRDLGVIGAGTLAIYEKYALIAELAVRPEYRRIGLGRKLMGALEETATMAKVNLLQLGLGRDLAEFYTKLGYKVIDDGDDLYATKSLTK